MFRTDWAGRSMVRSERTISDYDAISAPFAKHVKREVDNSQEIRPGGKAIADLLRVPEPLYIFCSARCIRVCAEGV